MSKKKSTLSFLKDNWIVKNLVLAVVFVLGVVLVAEILLCIFTRHGKEITVPDFRMPARKCCRHRTPKKACW